MASAKNRRPHHLFVHTVRDGDRLDSYCVAMHLPENSPARMRVLTDFTFDAEVAQGWLKKIQSLAGELLLAQVTKDIEYVPTRINL